MEKDPLKEYRDSSYFQGASEFLKDLNEIRMTKLEKPQAIKLSLIIQKESRVVIFVLQDEKARNAKGEDVFWEGYYNSLRSVKQFIKEDVRKDKQASYLKHFKALEDKVPTKIKKEIDQRLHLY